MYGTETGTGELTRKIRLGGLMSEEEEEELLPSSDALEAGAQSEQDMDITDNSAACAETHQVGGSLVLVHL